jgi:autotransporter strand-loop-strand O-heptosyltransferase
VVDWLNNRGYTVKLVSKENDDYMGNKLPKGIVLHPKGPIERVMMEMKKSKAFIGIGSGLSWLSWSLDVPTVLISGFSYDWAEMQDCVRIASPKGKCEGCFNRIKLDGGDWNWCPDHKGTERQFECTKSITSEMVIKELEKFL